MSSFQTPAITLRLSLGSDAKYSCRLAAVEETTANLLTSDFRQAEWDIS